MNSPDTGYICDICNLDFSDQNYCRMHIKVVHEKCSCKKSGILEGPDLKECSKCVKVYLKRVCIHEHLTKSGNWVGCGKAFHNTVSFKRHLATHDSGVC